MTETGKNGGILMGIDWSGETPESMSIFYKPRERMFFMDKDAVSLAVKDGVETVDIFLNAGEATDYIKTIPKADVKSAPKLVWE